MASLRRSGSNWYMSIDFIRENGSIDNLRMYLDAATADDIRNGILWYRTARRETRQAADLAGIQFETMAAMVAALSPGMPWSDNVAAAYACAVGMPHSIGGTAANWKRAENIRDGILPSDKLGKRAPKTNDFLSAIMGQDSPCIDSHMIAAYTNAAIRGRISFPAGAYKACQNAIYALALETGYTAVEIQAIVWLVRQRVASKLDRYNGDMPSELILERDQIKQLAA